MDLTYILATKIKPELNHIYTERPFLTRSGWDLGWFCRENALHLYGLAVLLRRQADICTGDYILRRPGHEEHHSIGDRGDHAWCRIDGSAPVDVSITVKHVYPDMTDIRLVFGDRRELCDPFEMRYCTNAPDETFFKLTHYDKHLIAYNEKGHHRYSLPELLSNPFQFLHRPPPGSPTFPEIHGPEVFYAITYHCYRLATEEIKPLCLYRSPSDTVKRIMKNNPHAKDLIQKLLA